MRVTTESGLPPASSKPHSCRGLLASAGTCSCLVASGQPRAVQSNMPDLRTCDTWLPRQFGGTEHFSEAKLASNVTRDAMIGVIINIEEKRQVVEVLGVPPNLEVLALLGLDRRIREHQFPEVDHGYRRTTAPALPTGNQM